MPPSTYSAITGSISSPMRSSSTCAGPAGAGEIFVLLPLRSQSECADQRHRKRCHRQRSRHSSPEKSSSRGGCQCPSLTRSPAVDLARSLPCRRLTFGSFAGRAQQRAIQSSGHTRQPRQPIAILQVRLRRLVGVVRWPRREWPPLPGFVRAIPMLQSAALSLPCHREQFFSRVPAERPRRPPAFQ